MSNSAVAFPSDDSRNDSAALIEAIGQLTELLENLLQVAADLQRPDKWLTVSEAAKFLRKKRANFTIREWARLGRIACRQNKDGTYRFHETTLRRVERIGLDPPGTHRPDRSWSDDSTIC